MQKLIALACTVAAALAAQPAGAATCSRWQNQLSDCDVLDALCPNKTPSYEQSVIIDGQMYGDTPQDVCTKWANNAFEPGSPSYGKGTLAKTSSSPDSSWECYADANGDGVQQSTENDQLMYVNGNLQTEDCCSYIPKGPYARTLSDTVSPVAGRDFRSTQKDAVRAQNVVDLGTPPLAGC